MGFAKGIEHVGMTVPDIATAETFFEQAFDARVLYRGLVKEQPAQTGEQVGPTNGLPADNAQIAISMLRIGTGANLELFEVASPQGESPGIATLGPTHFSVYVDDLEAAGRAVVSAGGTLLAGPQDCFGPEAGEGNRIWFCRTPWRTLIELVHLPSPVKCLDPAQATRYIPT
ncbi:MAG: VOC family protein [Janthinobacterium lividum]